MGVPTMQAFYFILLILIPSYALSQEFKINLSSEYKKENVFQYSIKTDVKVDNDVVFDGVSEEATKFSFVVECTGKLTIKDISPKGQLMGANLKIESFKMENVVDFKATFKIGDVIDLNFNNKNEEVYLVNNIECNKEEKELASCLVSVKNDQFPTMQEFFGPKKAVKVGEKWEIDRSSAISVLKEIGFQEGKKAKIEGVVQLDKIDKYNNLKCFFVSGSVKMNDLGSIFSPETKVVESTLNEKISKIIPVEKNEVCPLEVFEMVFKVLANEKVKVNGVDKNLEIKISRIEKKETSWLPVVK